MSLEIARKSNWRDHGITLLLIVAAATSSALFTLARPMCVKAAAGLGAVAALVGLFAYPHLAIALLVLLLPLQNLFPRLHGGPLSTIQPSAILLPLIAMSAVARSWITGDYRVKWSPISKPVLAFCAGLVILAAFRPLVTRPPDLLLSTNVKMVGRFVMGTVLFFLMTQYITSRQRLKLTLAGLSIGGVVATVIGLAQYLLGYVLVTSFGLESFQLAGAEGEAVTRVNSTVGSPHSFAFLAGTLVLLMLCLSLYSERAWKRVFYLGAAGFFFAGVVATQTRAGVLMLAVGAAVLLARRGRFKLIAALVIALVMLQALALIAPRSAGRFGKTIVSNGGHGALDYSTLHRFDIYRLALDNIDRNVLLGSGLIYLKLRKDGSAWTAHNTFLDMWLAGGVVLMGLFTRLLWRALREMWLHADSESPNGTAVYAAWLLAVLAGTAAFIMVDIIECEYFRPIVFYYLLGCCAVVTRLARGGE